MDKLDSVPGVMWGRCTSADSGNLLQIFCRVAVKPVILCSY